MPLLQTSSVPLLFPSVSPNGVATYAPVFSVLATLCRQHIRIFATVEPLERWALGTRTSWPGLALALSWELRVDLAIRLKLLWSLKTELSAEGVPLGGVPGTSPLALVEEAASSAAPLVVTFRCSLSLCDCLRLAISACGRDRPTTQPPPWEGGDLK